MIKDQAKTIENFHLFMGIDLGTSGVKVTIVAGDGEIVAEANSPYPMYGTDEGKYEQAPEDWKEAIKKCMKTIGRQNCSLHKIRAIGLSAQMPTLVITDRWGKSTGNAVVWCDSRGDKQAEGVLTQYGKESHYEKTGVILDGRYIAPMYLWKKEYCPEEIPSGHYLFSAKDYLYFWLTGEPVTDPSTASGFGVYDLKNGCWDAQLCANAGMDIKNLPYIKNAYEVAGHLQEETALYLGLPLGIPIAVGAADSVAGVVGMGALSYGTVCQIWGTSTVIMGICNEVVFNKESPYLITPLTDGSTFGMEADLLSTGSGLKWMRQMLSDILSYGNLSDNFDSSNTSNMLACGSSSDKQRNSIHPNALTRLAAQSPPGSKGLIFYPYLSGGEQGVLWDSTLVGGILGLNENHRICDILRAQLEGYCFETKRCINAFQEKGFPVNRILCTGPITSNTYFMQLLSDILGYSCEITASENGSALGAAFLAGISMGHWSLKEIPELVSKDIKRANTDFKKNSKELKKGNTEINLNIYYPNSDLNDFYNNYYVKYKNHTNQSRINL